MWPQLTAKTRLARDQSPACSEVTTRVDRHHGRPLHGIAIANGAAVQLRRELRHLEFEVRLFKSLNADVA